VLEGRSKARSEMMTTDVTAAPHGRTDHAARFVVRAAMMALVFLSPEP
jgi:hypothetical protein